jgi:type IV secretory pathway VirB10-like protein
MNPTEPVNRPSLSSRWVIPLLAFAFALALGACGPAAKPEEKPASQDQDVASVTGQSEAADPKRATQGKLHEFGECMRAAGFDIPDPASRDAVKLPPEAYQGESRRKASKCYQLLPPAELEKADPATMAERLEYARCMRAHGVPETQDPTEEGLVVEQPAVNYSSKRFKDAYKACTGQDYSADSSGDPVG